MEVIYPLLEVLTGGPAAPVQYPGIVGGKWMVRWSGASEIRNGLDNSVPQFFARDQDRRTEQNHACPNAGKHE